VEYKFMSKLKSLLVNSVSIVAVALCALSFAFAGARAYAENLENSSQVESMFLDTDGEVAEWWVCSNGGQTCINTHQADLQAALGRDGSARVADEIKSPPPDEASPPGIHSVDAIKVEITQSVTIAAAGEVVDEHEEVTGSISERAATAVEPVLVIEAQAQASAPDREE
jgi:hypothetical protein